MRRATDMDVGNTRSCREHDWCGRIDQYEPFLQAFRLSLQGEAASEAAGEGLCPTSCMKTRRPSSQPSPKGRGTGKNQKAGCPCLLNVASPSRERPQAKRRVRVYVLRAA